MQFGYVMAIGICCVVPATALLIKTSPTDQICLHNSLWDTVCFVWRVTIFCGYCYLVPLPYKRRAGLLRFRIAKKKKRFPRGIARLPASLAAYLLGSDATWRLSLV